MMRALIPDGQLTLQTAINGLDCLTKLYSNKESRVDLLLIDEDMPYMKGSFVIRELKRLKAEGFHKNIKLVSISGNTGSEFIKFIIETGCDEVLSKDVRKNDLIALIAKLFPTIQMNKLSKMDN
jgi:CheY-like chemotaxis protein